MKMAMRFLACAALCASLVIPSAAAFADEPAQSPVTPAPQMSAVAQRHFDDAVAFYRAGNYDAAKVEFGAAYDLSRLPDLLHNLSLVAERQGRLTDAIALEERCLAEKGKDATEPEQDEARGRIARLRERLPSGTAPTTAPKPPMAVPTLPTSPADSTATQKHRPPAPAVALVSVGAALVLGGVGCGAGALVTQGQVNAGGPFFADEYDALLTRGRTLDRAAIGLGVVGGALVVSGAGWLIWHGVRGRKEQPRTDP